MGIFKQQQGTRYLDDMVLINQPKDPNDPCVITINCPDKTGLGCDLCRIILFFGLSIVKGDMSTDGKWCFVVLWVVGKGETRWELLKERLLGACPSASIIPSYCFSQVEQPRPSQIFLLKFWCYDRLGLLHDVTRVLCELELTIRRVKVSTTPDGRVMDLFFITDTRELLHTKSRRKETIDQLDAVLGDSMIDCEIESATEEIVTYLQKSSALSSPNSDVLFLCQHSEKKLEECPTKTNDAFITTDNSLSRCHTLIQIFCRDQKALLYDIMRTLKDYSIQVSYGRFYTSQYGNCEIDLFVIQSDGKKITDPDQQRLICSRLKMEIFNPIRVSLINRGPDMELLVANPVEYTGKGRPLVFHDITDALKLLNVCIFLVAVGRHVIEDKEWEVYRILLDDSCRNSTTRNAIKDGVMKKVMGWE